MARAAGILTATGGIASHAAVVARGWGIPAVVGASGIEVRPGGIVIDGLQLPAGEIVSIDGGTGEVYQGRIEAETAVAPEARTLQRWARELGIAIRGDASTGGASSDEPAARLSPGADPTTHQGLADPETCLWLIGIKGFATLDAIAAALGCSPEAAQAAVDRLLADGIAGTSAGAWRLTTAGQARHRELLDRERSSIGADRIDRWFDAFLELDRRAKAIVTAWQVRDDAPLSEPVLNDHADAAYDERVLARLAELVPDADAWLASVAAAAPRFGLYRRRLRDAATRAASGDHRFIASPRVDSCHGVWFELHEDLIALAGRTRAEEVAVGRA
jgi:pyruvate,orthophosphate dikinase